MRTTTRDTCPARAADGSCDACAAGPPRLPRSRQVAIDWLWLIGLLASAALIVRGAVAVVGDVLWVIR